MIYQLSNDLIFPDPLLADESGLLAVGGDLDVDRLLLAYSQGIFPWFNPGELIMWWSPAWRPIFIPGEIKISKSLRRTIRKNMFEIRFDTQFGRVIQLCGELRKHKEGTWITDEMVESYSLLHKMGYAHSVETYLDGQLVGGLYGVAIGKAFFGESMFHTKSDASKVALVALSENLRKWGFQLIDSQVSNNHLLSLGAMEIHRSVFIDMLQQAIKQEGKPGKWENEIEDLGKAIASHPQQLQFHL